MDVADLARRLDRLDARLDDVVARLDRVTGALDEAERLRESLRYERDARRALADQTTWLIEVLGETRKELRWLRQERERLQSGG